MKRLNYIYLILISILLSAGCSSIDLPENGMVVFSYSVKNFNISGGTSTRSSHVGTAQEQQVDNLYLLLFNGSGTNAIKYYVDNTFTNGTWNKAEGEIILKLSQAEAGTRQVYVVANVSTTLKTVLDGVSTLIELQAVMKTTSTPWSSTLKTPILMSGNATHNFVNNRILNSVSLTRTLAKVELNVTLPSIHQDSDPSHYKYNFIDFDKNSYALKPTMKTDVLVTSGWQQWQATSDVSSYTLLGGKVAILKVVTYINERDNAGSYIDIELPYNHAGPLPPPEFGNDTFKLPLPEKIERNYWYKFDITL